MRCRWSLFLFISAATLCQTAPVAENGYLAALAGNAREQIRQGKIADALKSLAEIEKRSTNDPEAKFAMGQIFQELAAIRAEQLQRVAPESAAAHELLGKAFESRGKLDEALTEYRSALAKSPNSAGLHFLIGNAEWKRRNFEAAEADLKAELKLNPHHAMANLRLGQIVLNAQREDPTRAVAYLQEATADAKSSLEAHRELGKALRLAHRYPEAVKELRLVEAQAPNDDSVHAQLAALYKEMGNRELARQEIELHAKILREKLQASEKARAEQEPQTQ